MYSFDPTEEQHMLIDAIQRYAANDLRAKMRDADEENQLPIKLIEKGWELGILQASVPEEYGGLKEYIGRVCWRRRSWLMATWREPWR